MHYEISFHYWKLNPGSNLSDYWKKFTSTDLKSAQYIL